MKNKKIRGVTLAGVMAALVCVLTVVVRIPTPATGGYVHLGDAAVLLSAFWLGSVYGPLAAGIGSALADLIGGYPHYIPGTFFIKGLSALIAWALFHLLRGAFAKRLSPLARTIAAVIGEAVMVGGYFLYAALLLGKGTAAAALSVPGNVVQALIGIVIAVPLSSIWDIRKLREE